MDPENYAIPRFEGQLFDGDFSNVVYNGDEAEADQNIDIIEQWKPATDLVLKATHDAWEESPHFDTSSPEVFQQYWSRVFSELRASIIANSDIPEYTTEPPSKGFEILFFDQYSQCCPCDLPNVPQNINIFRPGGVTNDDLVKAIGQYLYGQTQLPRVYSLNGGKPVENKGALVYYADWMSGSSSTGGSVAFPCYFAKGHQIMSIAMYCCSKNDFLKKWAGLQEKRNAVKGRVEARVQQKEEEEEEEKERLRLKKEAHDHKEEEKHERRKKEKLRTTSRTAERTFIHGE